MSYSRWSDSKWYAFYRSDSPEGLESQMLSLWHCDEEQTPNATLSTSQLSGSGLPMKSVGGRTHGLHRHRSGPVAGHVL